MKKTTTTKLMISLLTIGMLSSNCAMAKDTHHILKSLTNTGSENNIAETFRPIQITPINSYEENSTKNTPSNAYVDAFSPATAQLVIDTGESTLGTCTGTLLAYNIFLTSAGCIGDTNASDMQVRFNYQTSDDNSTLEDIISVPVVGILEQGNDELNYALIQLADNNQTEASEIAAYVPSAGDLVSIIHHPFAQPKAISYGTVFRAENNNSIGENNRSTFIEYNVSTVDGSIGAGVLDYEGKVIGLNLSSYEQRPKAILIAALIKISPILERLLAGLNPIAEEPIVEEPIVEEPIVEEPIVEEPIVEEPIVEEPIVEEPIVEEPIVEEPIVEEPIVEEPIVEEPIVEEPIVEEPIVETPIADRIREIIQAKLDALKIRLVDFFISLF